LNFSATLIGQSNQLERDLQSCETYWKERNAFRVLVSITEGKSTLAVLTCGMEDNIKVYYKLIEWKGVDWVNAVQNRQKILARGKNIGTFLPTEQELCSIELENQTVCEDPLVSYPTGHG
jgi:hypothetical protein